MSTLFNLKEKIYAEYSEKVKKYVRSHIADRCDREDVVSEVFLKVYSNLDRYDEGRASLSTWIYTITKNTVIDYYRSRKNYEMLTEIAVTEKMELDSDLEALTKALERLGERERELIILHYYNGYTLKVVADMMRISYVYAKIIHKKALDEIEGLMKG